MRKIMLLAIFSVLTAAVSGQTGASGVQSVTVTLTANQLSSLKASPITIIPAPGPGWLIAPISMVVQFKAGSAPYAVPAGGTFSFTLGPLANSEVVSSQIGAAGFIDQANSQVRLTAAASLGDAQNLIENQDLRVSNDGAAEWLNGNGSVTITVAYATVQVQ